MPFSVDLINAYRKGFRYEWIWQKKQGTGHLNANKMPLKIHENILIFYDKLPTYHPQKRYGFSKYKRISDSHSSNYGSQRFIVRENTDGSRYPVDVLEFPTPRTSSEPKLHPTQKPVPLLEYLIRTYTDKGDVILDNCMGSGSTGVACVNTGRKFIGIELDGRYFSIAEERIRKAGGNQ